LVHGCKIQFPSTRCLPGGTILRIDGLLQKSTAATCRDL